jgi:cephalosporin hydroxylase
VNDDRFEMGPDLRVGRENQGDLAVLAHCLDLIEDQTDYQSSDPLVAVEFGVGHGHSLRLIARTMRVIGFDSFMGLPEDWRPTHRRGHFGDAVIPADVPGATIVPGWFEDTVPGYDFSGMDIGLVHLDADLYSSTVTALNSIGPWIKPGCILVFDEFYGYDDDFKGALPGEQQAWWEFVDNYPWPLEYDVIGHGREQWAVRVR